MTVRKRGVQGTVILEVSTDCVPLYALVAPGDFVFVDGGVPHAIGGGCFMVELQEPSDLMVVAERFTPSGRRIPDAKMHGGVGWERMFDVYEYDGRTYEETCARYVRKCSQIINVHKSSWDTNGANANVNFEAIENTKEHKDFVNSVPFVAKNNPCGSARGGNSHLRAGVHGQIRDVASGVRRKRGARRQTGRHRRD